jgi:hypothetical protein
LIADLNRLFVFIYIRAWIINMGRSFALAARRYNSLSLPTGPLPPSLPVSCFPSQEGSKVVLCSRELERPSGRGRWRRPAVPPYLEQPLLDESSAGQLTCLKVTSGLSAPLNLGGGGSSVSTSVVGWVGQGLEEGVDVTYQSKRQLQPSLSAAGKPSHSLLELMPP